LGLGLLDYGLRYVRFEAMLRTTPQEQREDQRAMEGDVGSRAQRRRLARSWRGDSPELLAGASLVLLGNAGFSLVLSGGPPPRRIVVRTAVKGSVGLSLRRSAQAMKIAQVDAPELVRRLAPYVAAHRPLPAELIAELAAIWPPG
jgi:flagellar biosynthetic protein FlhB